MYARMPNVMRMASVPTTSTKVEYHPICPGNRHTRRWLGTLDGGMWRRVQVLASGMPFYVSTRVHFFLALVGDFIPLEALLLLADMGGRFGWGEGKILSMTSVRHVHIYVDQPCKGLQIRETAESSPKRIHQSNARISDATLAAAAVSNSLSGTTYWLKTWLAGVLVYFDSVLWRAGLQRPITNGFELRRVMRTLPKKASDS